MRHPGEPSVEEILESIKRVIARDDRGGRPSQTGAVQRAAAAPAPAPPENHADRDRPARPDDGILDLAQHDYAYETVATSAPPPPAPAPLSTHPPIAAGSTEAPLVTEAVSANLRGSLDTLAVATGHAPSGPAPDGLGVETLLRELLRPALAEWLDRNLPAIVERLVAAEVARITGRRD